MKPESYYDDIKKLLLARSLDPSRIKRIFVTHPDTDHASASGYFHDEFGADVFMHPEATTSSRTGTGPGAQRAVSST